VGVRTTDRKAGPPLVDRRRPDAAVERASDNQPTPALIRAIEQTVDTVFAKGDDGTLVCVNPFTDLAADTAAEAFASTARIVKFDRHDLRFTHVAAPRRAVTHEKESEAAVRRLNRSLELQAARIAGVLHDEAGQFLASAHMAIADISLDVPPAVQARLQEVRLHLFEVAEQLRRISNELHPGILDHLGLVEAVKSIARAFTRRTGIQLVVEAQVDEPCPATAGAIVYRFVQAALANIGEHAHAASASVSIAREGSRLLCVICDDGAGFDVDARLARTGNQSRGLMMIRDRLEAVGGTLAITSAPQQGTRLRALVPLDV